VGLIQELGYAVPQPNAAQRAMWIVASSRPGSWLFARSLHRVDKGLLAVSRGRLTVPELLAGLPVLSLTTTGARSGQARTTPLVGVPFGDDLAIIGTRFGQPGTPGWYYNLRAKPEAEVAYRSRSASVRAREADEEERQVIWDRARTIYAGYEAYARRIKNRKIHIMVLSA
jgi:deazaflavin-dependent oxidoreductase (nitroreductase family)